jgi:hypothetical protein
MDEDPVKSEYAMDQIQFGIFGAGIVTKPTQNPGAGGPPTYHVPSHCNISGEGEGGSSASNNGGGGGGQGGQNGGACDQCDGGAAGVLRLV